MGPISVLHKSLQPDQWTDYVSVPEDYTAYFSPSYKESNEFCMGWERCPSFPGISGFCARSTTITAKYVSESEAATEEAMEGFQARVFQHEADHCLGLTFIHPISAGGKLKLDSHLENEAFEILVKEKIEKLKEGVNEFLTRMSEDAECRNLLSSINEEKRFQLALRGLSSKEIVKEFYEDFRDVMEDTREIETKFKF